MAGIILDENKTWRSTRTNEITAVTWSPLPLSCECVDSKGRLNILSHLLMCVNSANYIALCLGFFFF